MSGIPVQICDACGHAVFPVRALCPRCGCREWHTAPAAHGVVEQVTTTRRGGVVASVAMELGPIVIARSEEGAAPGSEVGLELDGGAPVARLGA